MERPEWAPEGIDIGRPSAARIYDYWLGGSHNFAVDRETARSVTAVVPDTARIMQANRAFLHRAVRFLVDQGIRQFLDLGSGIPTLGNVHEVAQKSAPDAQGGVCRHRPGGGGAQPSHPHRQPNATVIQADLRDTASDADSTRGPRLLDFDQPMAVLMMAVLHFVPDEDDPARHHRQFRSAIAPGSYLVLSHGTNDADHAGGHRPRRRDVPDHTRPRSSTGPGPRWSDSSMVSTSSSQASCGPCSGGPSIRTRSSTGPSAPPPTSG